MIKSRSLPWISLLRIAVGIAILVLLLIWLGADGMIAGLANLNSEWLVFVPLLLLINLLLGGIGLFVLLPVAESLSFAIFLKYHFFTQSLGAFLPLQLGESSLVLLLKRRGVSIAQSVQAYLTDKVTTLLVLFPVGGLSLIVLFRVQVLYLFLGTCTFILLFSFVRLTWHLMGEPRLDCWLRNDSLGSLYGALTTYRVWIRSNQRGLVVNLLTTLCRRVVLEPLMQFFFLTALGASVPLELVIIVSNVLALISLFPITAQGLGIVELSAVYLFSLAGMDSKTIATAYIIARPFGLAFNGLVLGTTWLWMGSERNPRATPLQSAASHTRSPE